MTEADGDPIDRVLELLDRLDRALAELRQLADKMKEPEPDE